MTAGTFDTRSIKPEALCAALSELTGTRIVHAVRASQSSFDRTFVAQGACDRFFVKLSGSEPRLRAEFDGLRHLARTRTVRVPQPIAVGAVGPAACLVTEFIELAPAQDKSYVQLGGMLAAMHRHTFESHGWHQDNFIGATAQPNARHRQWTEFFRSQRLDHQLRLARENGHHGEIQSLGAKIASDLESVLCDHEPPPSLVHGDLWHGNCGFDHDGLPVIYDPAAHCADRETDLAMTQLFGGFAPQFYQAYCESWPLPEGYRLRSQVYNLYHVLNHLNLFGGSYSSQAVSMMRRIAAALR